jgi:two-component system, response regulator YesN
MSLRKLTYVNQLAVYGIVLGIVPLAILGLFSSIRASTTIQSYVEVGNAQILKHSQLTIEQNLKAVETSVAAYLNSSGSAYSFNIPLNQEYFGPLTELQTNMRQLQVYELGVQDVTLYNRDYNWKMNNGGIAAYEPGTEEVPGLQELLLSNANSMWTWDENQVQFLKKNPLFSATPSSLIVAEIPLSHLSKLMLRTNPLGSTAILDREGKLLMHQDAGSVKAMLAEPDIRQRLTQDVSQEGQITLAYDGHDYGITFIRSEYNGWIYLAAAELELVQKESRAIRSFTLWTCAVIGHLILLASWFGSRNMYRPIRVLHDNLIEPNEEGTKEPSEEDHLQRIGHRVQGMLDKEKKMTSQLQMVQSQLKASFVQRLLLGDVTKREISEKQERYGFSRNWRLLKVMTVEIDTLEGTRYEEKDTDLLLFAISNMVGEMLPPSRQLIPVVLNNRQWSILGTEGGEPKEWNREIQQWAEGIQQAVAEYLGITVSIGISQPLDDWSGIPAGLKQAEETLKYRLMLGNEAIIYSEDVLSEPEEDVRYPVKLEQELISAIKNGYRQQAEEKLRSMMQELVKPPFHFQEYQLSLLRIMTEIGSLLQEESIPLRMIIRGEQPLMEQMSANRTVEDMEGWFIEKLILPVIELLEERRSSQFQKISDAVIGMIHQDFDTDLTLELCASRIDYHPHYVSKVFRQETGVNFSEYLLKHRLQMAKRWLTETDMTITEMAEKLKYTNPTNFIRYFRKIEGITPGQYREMNGSSLRRTE